MANLNMQLLDSVPSWILASTPSELAPIGVGWFARRWSPEGCMQTQRYILSQLVDSEELSTLGPEELREMLAELDDEVVNNDGDGDDTVTAGADPGR
ncbi:hypothetical protein CIK06_08790 [Plantactinospora sp. KBS50]|nr:hypothetical protein CIK06_08790 [Plantactinospora sp. KBS50]